MTLTSDHAFNQIAETDIPDVRLKVRDGARDAVRFAQRFGGVALSFAALGLLLLPFGGTSTAEVLTKLMVALVLGFIGAALWQSGSPVPTPELEIDMVRREVRLVRWMQDRRAVVKRRRFADLERADFEGDTVQLWEKDNNLLAEVSVRDEMGLRSLRRAMTDEGLVFEQAA